MEGLVSNQPKRETQLYWPNLTGFSIKKRTLFGSKFFPTNTREDEGNLYLIPNLVHPYGQLLRKANQYSRKVLNGLRAKRANYPFGMTSG